jgi:hypothetical protein
MSDNTNPTQPPTPCVGPGCGAGKNAPAPEPNPEWVNSIVSPGTEDLIPMSRSASWVVPEYSYYTFSNAREFFSFLKATRPQFTPLVKPDPSGDRSGTENAVMLMDKFMKAWENTAGGCGCNRGKRVQFAVDCYVEFARAITEVPEVCGKIKELLNNVERVHFWKDGQKVSNQQRVFVLSNNPKANWRDHPPESPFLII